MSQPVIDISDLDFAYSRQLVLSKVDLRIEAGDFVAFLGPNGGGKSTLLKLLLGLLRPLKGTIKVLGQTVGSQNGHYLAKVGYVPQDYAGDKVFPATVEELVLTGCLRTGSFSWRWSSKDRKAAQKALELVGLWQRRNWRLDRLSGGQRQRVMIARALAGEPELILMDEPVASVDQEWQSKLFSLFQQLNQKTTICLVSHDLTAVSQHIKSVVCVNQKVHYHPKPEITPAMLSETYRCPVELIAHGLPHRVLAHHDCCGDDHA